MSRILVLGGGFSGVVAAERLAKELGARHQVLDMGFPVSRPDRESARPSRQDVATFPLVSKT